MSSMLQVWVTLQPAGPSGGAQWPGSLLPHTSPFSVLSKEVLGPADQWLCGGPPVPAHHFWTFLHVLICPGHLDVGSSPGQLAGSSSHDTWTPL